MKCPFCGFKNIPGSDECEVCLADLTSIDGLAQKASRNEFVHKVLDQPLYALKPRAAVSVKADASVADVIRLMNDIKAGCILVENHKGKLVGIVTERDILSHLPSKLKSLNEMSVTEIMTTNVEVLRADNSLNQALHQMSVKRFRHLVVYNAQGKRGVVSTRDLMKHLSQYLKISKKPLMSGKTPMKKKKVSAKKSALKKKPAVKKATKGKKSKKKK